MKNCIEYDLQNNLIVNFLGPQIFQIAVGNFSSLFHQGFGKLQNFFFPAVSRFGLAAFCDFFRVQPESIGNGRMGRKAIGTAVDLCHGQSNFLT